MWPNPALSTALQRDLNAVSAVRDFSRENARRLREVASSRRHREAKERIEEERRSRRTPLKATQQFQHVRPKVVTNASHRSKGDGGSSSSSRFLKGHQKTGPFLKGDKTAELYSSRSSVVRKSRSVDHLDPSMLGLEESENDLPLIPSPSAALRVLKGGYDVGAPSMLSGRETRFSELEVEIRRSRIEEIVADICDTRPLADGGNTRRGDRSPSLGRRSRSYLSLLDGASVSNSRRPFNRRGSSSTLASHSSSMVSRSVQTDGETAMGQAPITVVSRSRREDSGAGHAKESSNRIKEPLVQKERLPSAKKKSKEKSSVKAAPLPMEPEVAADEIEEGNAVLDRLRAVEDEVRDLRLDLGGIEGAFEGAEEEVEKMIEGEEEEEDKMEASLPVVKGVGVDYVLANRDCASAAGRAKRAHSVAASTTGRSSRQQIHEAGAVPKYLTRRKEKWRLEKERREMDRPDPNCPPGHVRLTEEERRETLERLSAEYEAAVREQSSLPVGSDTLRVRRRRREVEEALARLDEAIRTYSRPVVYVLIEEQDK